MAKSIGCIGVCKYYLLALSLVLLSVSATAQTESADAPPAPLQPHQIVQQGITRLNQFVAAYEDPDQSQIRRFLEFQIAPYFDFVYMAKWAAGPYHRRLTDEQRTKFVTLLTDTFLNALARNLGSYVRPLPTVTVGQSEPGRTANETVVPATVNMHQLDIQLLFRFYWSPDGWKIFDVAANGSSAVGYYRRYYVDLLRRHGPEAVLP